MFNYQRITNTLVANWTILGEDEWRRIRIAAHISVVAHCLFTVSVRDVRIVVSTRSVYSPRTNVTNRNTNAKDCPESYRSNSEKEELILTYAENFRRQYHHIYRDRKPLFLCPTNECGIPVPTVFFSINWFLFIDTEQKLVCTSIRPTVLPYSDLIEWKSTADFIADHLNYDPLKPAYELVGATRSLATSLWSSLSLSVADRAFLFNKGSRWATWPFFRIRSSALFTSHWCWIRCLRCQRVCDTWNLLHGYDALTESTHSNNAESARSETSLTFSSWLAL